MSLVASPATGIIIQNSNNTEKFNSNNKLVYRKSYQTGSLNYSSAIVTDISLNTSFNIDKDFGLIYIKPTSANGSISNQLLNSWVQLGFSLLTHASFSTTTTDITAWDTLSGAVIGNGSSAILRFEYLPGSGLAVGSSISFDWKLVVLSYR